MKFKLNEQLTACLFSIAILGCATAENSAKTVAATAEAPAAAAYAKPGFYTNLDKDGRLWVFIENSAEHKAYLESGKPAKQVRRIGAGPQGQTLISAEIEHLDAYQVAKPGFYTAIDKDGRLWVFPEGHADHLAYKADGKPAKQVRRIGAGPGGRTVISTEMEHIDGYLAN